jgi:predicted enzyme related to lactoylglutathione lyase
MTNRPVVERVEPVLGVDDVASASEFYRRVLGFEVAVHDGHTGAVARDDVALRLVRRSPGAPPASVYFRVQGLDAYAAEVRARGGAISDLVGPPGPVTRFSIRDPGGNTLMFGD